MNYPFFSKSRQTFRAVFALQHHLPEEMEQEEVKGEKTLRSEKITGTVPPLREPSLRYAHISSFYDTKEPNPDNEVGRIFRTYPQLSVVGMTNYLGIHKSLLDRYIYGMVEPSPQRMLQIKEALHAVGRQLIAV